MSLTRLELENFLDGSILQSHVNAVLRTLDTTGTVTVEADFGDDLSYDGSANALGGNRGAGSQGRANQKTERLKLAFPIATDCTRR